MIDVKPNWIQCLVMKMNYSREAAQNNIQVPNWSLYTADSIYDFFIEHCQELLWQWVDVWMKTFHMCTPSKALFHSSCLPPFFSPAFSAFSGLLGNLRPTEFLFIRSDMRCINFYLTRGRCPSRDIIVLRVLYFCIKAAVTCPSGDDFFSLCACFLSTGVA